MRDVSPDKKKLALHINPIFKGHSKFSISQIGGYSGFKKEAYFSS